MSEAQKEKELKASVSSEKFTVSALEEADTADYRREVKERDVQKAIDKSQSSWAKLQAERAKVEAKAEAKREVEIEEAKKRPYLLKIQQYLDRFPWLVEKLGPAVKVTTRTSLPELVYTLGIIRNEMDSKMSLSRLVAGVDMATMFLETTWGDGTRMAAYLPKELQWNLTGLHKMWKEGAFVEDLLPVLQEIDIEYPWVGKQSLPMRTVAAIVTVMAKVNMTNSAKLQVGIEKKNPIDIPTEELN